MSQSNENTTVKAAMVVLQDGNGNPIPISPEVMSTTVIFTDGVTLEERAASYISADNTAQLGDLIVNSDSGVASKNYVDTQLGVHNISNTAHADLRTTATSSANGLMSSTDKAKLDTIAQNANNYTHPSYTQQGSGLYKITVDNTGHVSAATTVTKSDITALAVWILFSAS